MSLKNISLVSSTLSKLGFAFCLFVSLVICSSQSAFGKPSGESSGTDACWDARNRRWHSQETWAWHQLCLGLPADLADYSPELGARTLSSRFIADVLANQVYRDVLPFGQIFVRHASFGQAVDLSDATIARDVRLDDCIFEAGLSLARASSNAPLSLNNVRISGGLNVAEYHGTSMFLMGLSASRGVDAHDISLTGNLRSVLIEQSDMDLDRASVEGYVEAEGSLGSVSLQDARLKNLIFANASLSTLGAGGAHLRSISLSNVRVNGNAYLENAVVEESLTVKKSRIGISDAAHRGNISNPSDACYIDARALDGDNAVFGSILLAHANVDGFSLNRSTVNGQVVIHNSRITRACMKDGVINGVLDVAGTRVSELTDIGSVNVERNAYFTRSELSNFLANEAVFGGSCELQSVRSSSINFMDTRFTRRLFIQELQGTSEIDASNATVGGSLTVERTTLPRGRIRKLKLAGVSVSELFTLRSLSVERADVANAHLQSSAVVENLRLSDKLSLAATNVEGDLRLIDVDARYIDLSDANISRSFYLQGKSANRNETLSLRDTIVQTLEDSGKAKCDEIGNEAKDCLAPWPGQIDLEGFRFSQLGSGEVDGTQNLYTRDTGWWKNWLRQKRYVPQAYDTLSNVLQGAGYDQQAKDIAIERRDQEQAASGAPSSFLMWLWRIVDGYGYGIYYALFWAALFLAIGACVLYGSGEYSKHERRLGLTYSFDMLVPLIFLEKEHETIRLVTWARYYFYAHKIVGYILATMLVAGLSVLVK